MLKKNIWLVAKNAFLIVKTSSEQLQCEVFHCSKIHVKRINHREKSSSITWLKPYVNRAPEVQWVHVFLALRLIWPEVQSQLLCFKASHSFTVLEEIIAARWFAFPFHPVLFASHALGRQVSFSLCPTSKQLNCTESNGWELSFSGV